MIEKIILDYLSNELPLPVYMETPEKIPSEYILVEKAGSSRENFITKALITIKSISSMSLYRAATINEEVIKTMDMMISLPNISRSELNSDYNFTDTTTKQYRYQAVYDITYMEE